MLHAAAPAPPRRHHRCAERRRRCTKTLQPCGASSARCSRRGSRACARAARPLLEGAQDPARTASARRRRLRGRVARPVRPPLELERIQTARSRIDDAWVAQRSDREVLPFARACSTADQLATRLRDTATWRREWARTDEDWSFDTFFTSRKDAFYRDIELDGEMMEWLGGESNAPCTTEEGASLLILRPARYKLGTVAREDWLRLIAWHGARATSEWPSDNDTDKAGHGAVAIIVDRTCSGVRNQDPRLLRFLLPPLIRHYPASLHRAYVGPVNTSSTASGPSLLSSCRGGWPGGSCY